MKPGLTEAMRRALEIPTAAGRNMMREEFCSRPTPPSQHGEIPEREATP